MIDGGPECNKGKSNKDKTKINISFGSWDRQKRIGRKEERREGKKKKKRRREGRREEDQRYGNYNFGMEKYRFLYIWMLWFGMEKSNYKPIFDEFWV